MGWRDSSAAERRMVEGESLVQSIQPGLGSHDDCLHAVLLGSDYILLRVPATPDWQNDSPGWVGWFELAWLVG